MFNIHSANPLDEIQGDSAEQIEEATRVQAELAVEEAFRQYPAPSDPSGVGLTLLQREFLDKDGVPTMVLYRTNWFARENGVWTKIDLKERKPVEWVTDRIRRVLSSATYQAGEEKVLPWPTTNSNLSNVAADLTARLRVENDAPAYLRLRDGYVTSHPIEGHPVIFRNGWVNAETGEFAETSPWLFSPSIVDANYDPNAKAPKFEALLNQMFSGRESTVQVALQLLGLHLAGVTGQGALFILSGTPGSGKTTLANIIRGIKTEGAVGDTGPEELDQRFGLAGLASSSLIMLPDMPKGARIGSLATSRVKAITGGDSLSVEGKGINAYSAQINAQVLMVSNYLPVFGDEAIESRVRYLLADGPNMRNSEGKVERLHEVILNRESAGVAVLALNALRDMRTPQGGYQVGYSETHADLSRQAVIAGNNALLLIDALDQYQVTGNPEDSVRLEALVTSMLTVYQDYEEELGKWKPSVRKVEDELRSGPLGVVCKRPKLPNGARPRLVFGVRRAKDMDDSLGEGVLDLDRKRREKDRDALIALGLDSEAAEEFLRSRG